MKKILVVSSVYPPEPVISAKVSFDIARKLTESNRVTVICPHPSRPLGYEFGKIVDEEKIERIVLDSYVYPKSNFVGRFKESFSFGKAVSRYITLHREDILIIYMVTWPFGATYIPIRTSRKNNIPIIVNITDIYPESMTSRLGIMGKILEYPLKKIDSYYLRKATSIISVSELTKIFLEKTRQLPANRVQTVRVWQEDSIFNAKYKKQYEDFIFMFVGSISPAANVPFIIEVFRSLNLNRAKLFIVGDGSEKEECLRLSKGYNNICFSSVVPEKVPEIQAQADVLLLTLKSGVGRTASPSKLPAYMFSSKPVIASLDKDSDAASIIESAGCGYVCESNDFMGFQALLKKMIEVPECERTRMGLNGKIYAQNYLSKQVNLDKIVHIILSSIKS